MRFFFLFALIGCDASRNDRGDQGMLQFGNEDLATANDLAGRDFAGIDLSQLPDLAVPSDLAGSDLTSGTVTQADTCGAAAAITAGTRYDDLDTTGLTDDYHIGALSNGTCNTNDNVYHGPDAAYSISVPSGKTLTVTVEPHNALGAWDPAIAIVENCADGSTCLAGHDDSNLTGNPESVSWTNSTGAQKSVFVIVDSYYQTTNNNHGQYSLTATLN
jgi:hypothetical protein